MASSKPNVYDDCAFLFFVELSFNSLSDQSKLISQGSELYSIKNSKTHTVYIKVCKKMYN